jgi:hypothetical protein
MLRNLCRVTYIGNASHTGFDKPRLAMFVELVQAIGSIQDAPARTPAIVRRTAAHIAQVAPAATVAQPRPTARTSSGLWPSDQAGVVATVEIDRERDSGDDEGPDRE